MFPRLPARATFVADTNFVSGTQEMFLILFRNNLCPQQMFPSLRSPRNMGNNVSATMCPRLPGPLHRQLEILIELRPTASFKFNEKKWCIFRIAKRFYNCCGFAVDEFAYRSRSQSTRRRTSKLFTEFPQKVSSKRTEDIWCLFGTKKRL